MVSKGRIKFYHRQKRFGFIVIQEDPKNKIFFHINDVNEELKELLETIDCCDEPVTCKTRASTVKDGEKEAFDVKLDLLLRSVGHITKFERGFGWIKDFHSKELWFAHHSNIRGAGVKFISLEEGDPVLFSTHKDSKGKKEAIDIVKIDNRCHLERFAYFENFYISLKALSNKAEFENWDYIKDRTDWIPVLFSYINHTFDRISSQGKLVKGNSSKDNKEYAYFNTGLVTPFQDEIYGYFEKIPSIHNSEGWHIQQTSYNFLEFETDQSRYRKFFMHSPEIATYFLDAEIKDLIFDASLELIIDKEHIRGRKERFPDAIKSQNDEAFFDSIQKSIELAKRRAKRNYKTAIPHFYDDRIQFLLPLCMLTKKDADLALVVNKEENVYKAHTVLTLDQAYNNARLLARPDREWLNP